MTYIVQNTTRGRENRAVGSPAGRENFVQGATLVSPPLQFRGNETMSATISTSIAWLSNVATHTCTGHGLTVGDTVRVASANEAVFNGDFRVDSVADANTFTCAVYGTGLSATGSPTARKICDKGPQ